MISNTSLNKKTRCIYLAAGLLTVFMCTSCTDEPYHLNASDQLFIDSVSNKEIILLGKNLDDSCNAQFNQRVKKLCDSIVEFQIKLIGRQLERQSE